MNLLIDIATINKNASLVSAYQGEKGGVIVQFIEVSFQEYCLVSDKDINKTEFYAINSLGLKKEISKAQLDAMISQTTKIA